MTRHLTSFFSLIGQGDQRKEFHLTWLALHGNNGHLASEHWIYSNEDFLRSSEATSLHGDDGMEKSENFVISYTLTRVALGLGCWLCAGLTP